MRSDSKNNSDKIKSLIKKILNESNMDAKKMGRFLDSYTQENRDSTETIILIDQLMRTIKKSGQNVMGKGNKACWLLLVEKLVKALNEFGWERIPRDLKESIIETLELGAFYSGKRMLYEYPPYKLPKEIKQEYETCLKKKITQAISVLYHNWEFFSAIFSANTNQYFQDFANNEVKI